MTQFATGLPVGRDISVKVASLARTDTATKNLFMLPKGAVPLYALVFSPVASNAATTAVVSVGVTGTGTFFLNTVDVKTAAGLIVPPTAKNTNFVTGLLTDTQVTGIYAETGAASNTGGPFYIVFVYMRVGPGDLTSAGLLVN
jgi:hypothetical protein